MCATEARDRGARRREATRALPHRPRPLESRRHHREQPRRSWSCCGLGQSTARGNPDSLDVVRRSRSRVQRGGLGIGSPHCRGERRATWGRDRGTTRGGSARARARRAFPGHAEGARMNRADRRYSDVAIYRRLLGTARRYWALIGAVFLNSLLSTPLALLTLVAVSALKEMQSIVDSLLRMYTGEKLMLDLRARLFRHVQRISLAYHDTRGTADSIYRVQSDATSIQTIAVDGVIPFVTALVTLGSMVLVVALIDPLLASIALVITPILLVLTWSYRRRLRQRHREVKRLESSALSVVQEVLGSLRVVKAFGQEEREEERFVDRSSAGMRARIRVTIVDSSFGLLTGIVTAAGSAVVLFVGFRQVQRNALTLGDLMLVIGYLSSLYAPLATITKRVTKLQSAFASAERVLSLLDEPREVSERPHARRLERASGHVVFDRVSFSYDSVHPVLEDIVFDVEP